MIAFSYRAGEFIYNFQTLIGAVIAAITVYWATRPAWKQVAIMAEQQRRSAIMTRYEDISKAISLMSEESWPPALTREDYIQGSDEALFKELDRRLVAFDRLQAGLAAIPLDLTVRGILDKHLAALKENLDFCRDHRNSEPRRELLKTRPDAAKISLYFHSVEQPDRMFLSIASRVKNDLEPIRTALVKELL